MCLSIKRLTVNSPPEASHYSSNYHFITPTDNRLSCYPILSYACGLIHRNCWASVTVDHTILHCIPFLTDRLRLGSHICSVVCSLVSCALLITVHVRIRHLNGTQKRIETFWKPRPTRTFVNRLN